MPASDIDLGTVLPLTDGVLTLSKTSASGDVLADVLSRTTGGAPILVRNASRSTSGSSVTVTGIADYMNAANVPVIVVAQENADGTIDLTARFTLIEGAPPVPGWRFSRSFPNLPKFATGQRVDESAGNQNPLPNTLDLLMLADAAFVISTRKSIDAVTGAPLIPGLNFVARQTPTGLFGLLETLISQGTPLVLHGPIVVAKPAETTPPAAPPGLVRYPWQQPTTPPGILLRADLPLDLTVGSALRLGNACARLYCPTDAAWAEANPSYPPYLAGTVALTIPSADITVEVVALGLGNPRRLSLAAMVEGVSFGKLTDLIDLAGGNDLASFLPDDLRAAADVLDGVSLEAVMLDLDATWRVTSTGVAVGLRDLNTEVLPGFTLDRLTAHFSMSDPFGPRRAVVATIGGHVEFIGVPLDVSVELPDVHAAARSTADIDVPVSRLMDATGLPLPEMPDLPINQLQLEIAANGAFAADAVIAASPRWTIDLGPTGLTVSNIIVSTMRSSGAGSSQVSGCIALDDIVSLGVNYTTPGNFVLRAELPEINLLQLIGSLANQKLTLPGGFDLTFLDTTVVIQKSSTGSLVFMLSTSMADLGTVAFEARRVSSPNSWGFAAGIALTKPRVSALPGLGGLKPFEDVFALDQLVMVASSFDDPAFQFPDLAAFAAPVTGARTPPLPSQGGVIAGFNVHAQWTINTSKEQALLKRLLGLDPVLCITLQIGEVPSNDSRLYLSYLTSIAGMPFACEFGGQIKDGQVGLYLHGDLKAKIQGRPVDFQVTMMLVANGAFFSGSMLGSISFEGLTLSNLALVIGCNWEAIPSLGVACTLTVKSFNSALAVFFDSTDPSRSLLAGAVSDLDLLEIVETLASSKAPSEIRGVLRQIALLHTKEFTIDGSLGEDLDALKLDDVAAAFAANGVALSASASEVLVVRGEPGKTWFVTNMAGSMMHYELAKRSDGLIRVILSPQLYCVPQATTLGALAFQQGFFVTARLKVVAFDVAATVLIRPNQGILVDAAMAPIVIYKPALLSLTAMDGEAGPRLSIATFGQPAESDATLRTPHALIDGQLTFLGVARRLYVSISERGFAFALAGQITPGFTADIEGEFAGLTRLSASGNMQIGIGRIDLGALGTADIASGAKASLGVEFNGSAATSKVSGSFEFAGQRLAIATFALDIDAGLMSLPGRITQEATAVLKAYLTDVQRWAQAIGRAALTGVTDMALTLRQVYKANSRDAARLMHTALRTADEAAAGLRSAYGSSVEEAAQVMRSAGYSATEVGQALKSAYNVTVDQISKLLRGAGYAASEVGQALQSVYGTTANKATSLLRTAGYGLNDIGNTLTSVYHTTADQTATALKAAGYAVDETGKFIKNTFKLGADELDKVLSGAGYSKKQIEGFFKDLGGEFEKFFDSATDALDPRNWF
jgi:hypothetical protein